MKAAKNCGIYKYVWHNNVIYVGKSQTDIEKRIQAHSREDKFQKYLADADVYYCLLPNESTTSIYELYYINKYKPILNVSEKYDSDIVGIQVDEAAWELYSPSKYWCNKNKLKPESVLKYHKSKIEWLKSMKDKCQDIQTIFSELHSTVTQSWIEASNFRDFARRRKDDNSFETYAYYQDTLLNTIHFLDEYDKWDKYSDGLDDLIKKSHIIIQNLER